MEQTMPADLAENLTLALVYLSSWKEKSLNADVYRAWKGYEFSVLDQLKDSDLVDFSQASKSLCLTEKGLLQARQIISRLTACLQNV